MSRLVSVALLWAQFLALGLFLYGFFPIKNSVGKGHDRGGTVDWPSQGESRHWWVITYKLTYIIKIYKI